MASGYTSTTKKNKTERLRKARQAWSRSTHETRRRFKIYEDFNKHCHATQNRTAGIDCPQWRAWQKASQREDTTHEEYLAAQLEA